MKMNTENRTMLNEMETEKNYATVLLLLSITEKSTKAGSPYVEFLFSDGETNIRARMFNCSVEDHLFNDLSCDSLVDVALYVENFKGKKSYTVKSIYPASSCSYNVEDFARKAPIDIERTFSELMDILSEFGDGESENRSISRLTIDMLTYYKDQFMRSSAGKTIHHNYLGGLLQHSFAMVNCAMKICEVYPNLDKELLVCGAALHDIGKIYEMATSAVGTAEYTEKGRMLGHSALGIMMVDYFNAVGFYNEERVLLLEHMIAAHHGHTEYGAIKEAAIPEAVVLHAIDMMDSRIFTFEDTLRDVEPGELTEQVFGLYNNTAYKALGKNETSSLSEDDNPLDRVANNVPLEDLFKGKDLYYV